MTADDPSGLDLSAGMDDPAPATLRHERETRKWQQGWMATVLQADGASWSQSKIAKVESGEQRLTWDERRHLAGVLGLRPEQLGVTLQAEPPVPTIEGYASLVAYSAELHRAHGESRRAIELLTPELERVGREHEEAKSDDTRHQLVDLRLALALAQGDIELDANLAQTTLRLTNRALTLAKGMADRRHPPELVWRVHHRHGNELRKAGEYRKARANLELALDAAPSGSSSRATTLVSLARLQYQDRDAAGFDESMAELRQLLDDTTLWTADFHPVAVLDNELRGSVVFGTPKNRRSQELRRLVEHRGLIPDPAKMAPHWHPIWGVSVAAGALMEGDVEAARAVAEQALPPAQREGYDRQILRLRRVLENLTDVVTSDALLSTAVNVVAAPR